MATSFPFARFSEEAKQALARAQDEAARSHHSYIGTEHLLLGLFQVEGAMAPRILADLGVEIRTVRDKIEEILGRNERIVVQQIIPTSRTKRVIEFAFEASRQMRSPSVGTHHLLLALLMEGEGIAARILDDLGVTVRRIRETIGRLSAAGMQEEPAAPGGPPPWEPHAARGGVLGSRHPRHLADGLDDLTAVELLAALLDRFGSVGAPPPRLLELADELRQVRHRKDAAVAAQDYEAAQRYREEELRLQEHATAQLDAWRHN